MTLTKQFDKPPRPPTGETPRGRVKEEAALAMGPGKATTDHRHHRTSGISLATLASGPQHHHAFVKPTTPHENASTTTLQRMPCDTRSHGEDQRAAADVERGDGADNGADRASEDDGGEGAEDPHFEGIGSWRHYNGGRKFPTW